MKTATSVRLLAFALLLCMLLSSCTTGAGGATSAVVTTGSSNPTGVQLGQESILPSTADTNSATPEDGTFNEGVVLVKYDEEITDAMLSQLGLVSATALYSGSSWYSVELCADADTSETVNYLRELGCFDAVDYDYIMNTGADTSSVDVSSNPEYANQPNLQTHNIPDAWNHLNAEGKNPGGSSDVIVAVIDTGVDYNHLDLRNNIWVNPAEIPDNGRDDDGNGYIDDIYGWDCVGDDNDPMDDNGHGTHVAGIIAAENNEIGGVGVAHNCKIMVLKAGNSSGYFSNSDIAEAIQYAYMNGASVINMSFGGYSISLAVEEALENAYNTCVLVAAAGNDSYCNQWNCLDHFPTAICYPAGLPYVIGVMSCDNSGTGCSSFSNFDHHPGNSSEYEVYANGENILSTWPSNKYAKLNGTSMAAPTVAGIAALLRSQHPDRETYSTKYLQSQIVNTAKKVEGNQVVNGQVAVDAYLAMTAFPKPSVHLYQTYIFDKVEFSSKNNDNGIIDAGETIRIGIELINHGGVASNVVATLDTIRRGDANLVDPYFEITVSQIAMSDIGTYSVRDCGLIYDNDMIVGLETYFEVVVSDNCPNDYLCEFNVNFSYENGLDKDDEKSYSNKGDFDVSVVNAVYLPTQFTEDTTLTANNFYILPYSTYIHEGVTVTIEPGTRIQFYTDDVDSMYYVTGIPIIRVAGKLFSNGSVDAPVEMFPASGIDYYVVDIQPDEKGYIELNYTNITNACISVDKADHCYFTQSYAGTLYKRKLWGGTVTIDMAYCEFRIQECLSSVFYKIGGANYYYDNPIIQGKFDACIFVDSSMQNSDSAFLNCVFQGEKQFSFDDTERSSPNSIRVSKSSYNARYICSDTETGTSYIVLYTSNNINPSIAMETVRWFARVLGGDIACIETEAELNFIRENVFSDVGASIGLAYGSNTWMNGEVVGDFMKEINLSIAGDGPFLTHYSGDRWGYSSYAQCYFLIEIPDCTYDNVADVMGQYELLEEAGLNNATFKGNAILNNLNDFNVDNWLIIQADEGYDKDETIGLSENYWGTTNETLIDKMIVDFDDYHNLADIVWKNYLIEAPSDTFPFVTDIYLINKDGEIVNTMGKGTVQVVVEFNRDMDTSIPLNLTFGSRAPYSDYTIEGEYVNARTWVGEYTLKAFIENGSQYFRISNGCATDDPFLKLYEGDGGRFCFEINMTSAQAMIMQAIPEEEGINLTWMQDDYDTLLGYNIYRSDSKDGNYVKLNPTILLPSDSTFLDENAEPGKTYWYTYTVVLTDFTESKPAGKVVATAVDTLAPNLYHTPVNQGYMNNNLVISCTASDNVAISTVTLYYRAVGATEWKTRTMAKQNDKYSVTIFGSELTLDGVEYYIVACDTLNSIAKGSADAPYTIVIKDASAISRKGDVDGDGTVTTKDALMLMQAINEERILSDDEFRRADLNGDGVLSSMEALRILQYINGNVTSLEM